MSNDVNIFSYLENIIKRKDNALMKQHISNELFNKSYSQFMINRYLSMHSSEAISSIIVKNQKALEKLTSNASHYMFLMRVIPQNKNSFVTYIK